MDPERLNERLSHISTQWSVLFQGRASDGAAAPAAVWRELLLRYSGAVYRYLLGAVRDADAAEELCQEFALRFLRGDFHRADPARGRFRDYLRTSLIHLVNDHYRRRARDPHPLPTDVAAAPDPAEPEGSDFLAGWREELLARTWQALRQASPDQHAVLLFRIANPETPSAEAAQRLSEELGRPLTAAWVRKTLQRAHQRYADLLLAEVEGSLETATPEQLREELRALDLLRFCGATLERRRG
jgi:RNA polymerase sigma-70 factor (ECF subfamily)